MSDFLEDHLRKAVKRREAPEGFSGRVMARVPQRRAVSRLWYGSIAAILACVLLFTGMEQYRRQQVQAREQQMQAKDTERQVVFALALAMEKFDKVNARLQKSAPKVTVQDKRGT